MCWNENVSLNTFIFTTFVLIFLYYNNEYTQYTLPELKNHYYYLVILSFTVMQLIEYFLWKSINSHNEKMNQLFSIIGWIVIRIIQPLLILTLLPMKYDYLRNGLFITYIAGLTGVSLYKYLYNPIHFITTVSKTKHLHWDWVYLDKYEKLFGLLYLLCLATSFITVPYITIYAFLLLVICYFYLNNTLANNSLEWTSMWCFTVNSVMLYYLIQILFILPYNEYHKIC